MCLISLLLSIIFLPIIFRIYCKLTYGICKSSKHLVGKVVVVTGGNAGVGYETARDLAERGARVILGCRSEARGTAARDKIVALTGNPDVHYRQLDLASLSSVRAFAANILATEKQLDILVNNAGVAEGDDTNTEDGLLVIMQINHFGPFLLTTLLLPLLKSSAPSRIVNVSSTMYKYGKIDILNDNVGQTYSDSKLCNVLMTVELERRLKGTGVTANSLCPGMVETEILNNVKNKWFKFMKLVQKLFARNAWEGAQTQIYLAVSPEVNNASGGHFTDCKREKITKLAQNRDVARKLWEVSEKLTKLK